MAPVPKKAKVTPAAAGTMGGGMKKMFANAPQAAQPTPAPAALPSAEPRAAGSSTNAMPAMVTQNGDARPQLTEEQIWRIEENRQKAMERQQAKKDAAQPTLTTQSTQSTSTPAPDQAAQAPPAQTPPAQAPPVQTPAEQTQARIEENRRKALERQEAKKRAAPVAQPTAQKPTTQVQTQAAAKTGPAVPDVGTGGAGEQTPTKPNSPARPGLGQTVTPEKGLQPRAATSSVGAANTAGINAAENKNQASAKATGWVQYDAVYVARLRQLRVAVLAEAKSLWSCDVGPQGFLTSLHEFKSGAGKEVALTGVIFKEMRARPNVIEQYQKMNTCGCLHEDAGDSKTLYGEDDVVWLEDGTLRVQLSLPSEKAATLATGLVVSVRGQVTADDHFKVASVCMAKVPDPAPLLAPAAEAPALGPFLALTSGFCASNGEEPDAKLAMARSQAIEFLLGRSADEELAQLGSAIQQLVICGGVFFEETHCVDIAAASTTIREADALLAEVAAKIPVHAMPGRMDPTNFSLPQARMLPHLFPEARKLGPQHFVARENPAVFDFEGGLHVVGHSGQPVEDLLRCTRLSSPLEALMLTREALHIAPTAPDTLAARPFTEHDPFVLEATPHVLFSGGHDHAAHEWCPSRSGSETCGTLCVCVPAFRRQPAIVLVNIYDPRDVRVQLFGDEK